MSFPRMAPERGMPPGEEELITRIRLATNRILDLTRAEISAARKGNVIAARRVEDRLDRERKARVTLLRLLKKFRLSKAGSISTSGSL